MTYIIESNAEELGNLSSHRRRRQVGRLKRVGLTPYPLMDNRYGVMVRRGSGTRTVDYRDPSGLGFSLKPPSWLRKLTVKKALSFAGKLGKPVLKLARLNPFVTVATVGAGAALALALRKKRPRHPANIPLWQREIATLRNAASAARTGNSPLLSPVQPSEPSAETSEITRNALMADTASVEAADGEPVMVEGDQEGESIAEKPVLAPTAAGPAAGLSLLQNAGPLVLFGVGAVLLFGLAKGVRQSRR